MTSKASETHKCTENIKGFEIKHALWVKYMLHSIYLNFLKLLQLFLKKQTYVLNIYMICMNAFACDKLILRIYTVVVVRCVVYI